MLLSEGNFATSRAYIDSNWVDGGISVEDYKLTSYSESSGDQGMAIPGGFCALSPEGGKTGPTCGQS